MSGRSVQELPRVSVDAFFETRDFEGVLNVAARDWRMAKVRLGVYRGGTTAAVHRYGSAPSPALIIIETKEEHGGSLVSDLEILAGVCDVATNVIVVGHTNDIELYRKLVSGGVSDYIVMPLDALQVISALSAVFSGGKPLTLARCTAFLGACGGVGSSVLAHNVSHTMSKTFSSGDVVLIDLDVPFGTSELNFDRQESGGLLEALLDPDRLDSVLIERLLQDVGNGLYLLSTTTGFDRAAVVPASAYGTVVRAVRESVSRVVVDMPHVWHDWVLDILTICDDVVITAVPTLSGLRNTKNILGLLKEKRPNDSAPFLIINQVGMKKASRDIK